MEPLLRTVNLSKRLGTLPALSRVSLDVYPGEVVGLAGESGSGRSVLCMLLAGLYAPDQGRICFAGQWLHWPFQVRELGIEAIQQTPNVIEEMDITSNIFLGSEINWPLPNRRPGLPNLRKMDKEAARILEELGVRVSSLREKAGNLSSEQRQLLSIARTLTRSARLVIVDDPASLLSYTYEQKLLSLIEMWAQQGIAVIFNSNNLKHLFAVTDRIAVLHQGSLVAEYCTDETDREEIVAAMVGTTNRQQLTPVIWALERYQSAREQAETLHHQQSLLEKNLEEQGTLNRQLTEQWAQQIDALDRANRALRDAQRRLLTEREEERKLVAREIHDLVIQDLLGVNYQLEQLKAGDGAPPEFKHELIGIREIVRDLVDDLRHICGNLRPPTIDSLGLGVAIESFIHDWSKRTAVSVSLDLDANMGRLPEDIELSIFRIVQEGLNNVRKHAQASTVEIFLKRTSPRTMVISIADDGRGLPDGFDLSELLSNGHYGLLGLSERVALLGGRLRLQNQTNGGLLIQAEIPHPRVTQPSEAPLAQSDRP